MQYYDGQELPPFEDVNWFSKQSQKYGEWFMKELQTASADPVTWQQKLDEAWRAFEGHGIAPEAAPAYGSLQSDKMDIAQLAAKLTLNSLYGFTGVKIAKAVMPMMMLAAAITAIGRHVLGLTKNVAERVNGQVLLNMYREANKCPADQVKGRMEDMYRLAGVMLDVPDMDP